MEKHPGQQDGKEAAENESIKLIPQPTDDPTDPLNWSTAKKLSTLFIVTLAGFIGLAQTVAANSGYFVQAGLYGKTAVQLSYGVSVFLSFHNFFPFPFVLGGEE